MNFPQRYMNEQLIINFVEKQKQDDALKRFYTQTVLDQSHIDFNDLLERQWSQCQQPMTKAFQQIKPQALQQQNINNPVIIESHQSFLNTSRQPEKNNMVKIDLRPVDTIFPTLQQIQDLTLFLNSKSFNIVIRIAVIINMIGLALFDYRFRYEKLINPEDVEMSLQNVFSLNLQLYANSVFTLQILLQLISKQQFFTKSWNILNLLTTIACWSTIFLDFTAYDDNYLFKVLMILRILKVLRIIEVFEAIRNPFEVFIATLPALSKIFFPLLIFMSFYAIIGTVLFNGASQKRCRQTPAPLANQTVWPEVNSRLCGAMTWECPAGYCGNPFTYGLPLNEHQQNQKNSEYGLVTFNSIWSAFLTVYHYVFLSNWTYITYKFSRFINPYLTSLYFVSLATFLFFITANLIMISLCKAYLEKQKLYQKYGTQQENNQQQKISDRNLEDSNVLKTIKILDFSLIFIQALIIIFDYEGISAQITQILSIMDFSLTWISLAIITIRFAILRKKIFNDILNVIDWIALLFSIVDILYCLYIDDNILNPQSQLSQIFRSIKFVRILKILFQPSSFFVYQRRVLNLFFQTLKSMRYFLLLLLFIVLTFSLIGASLFAYRVRFDTNNQLDLQNGTPYVVNFQNLYKSIIHIVILFENERWTETMYNYYYACGVTAIIFFCVTVFIVHLLLTRLFIAVFLCYFRRNLEKTTSSSVSGSQQSVSSTEQDYKQTDSKKSQLSSFEKEKGYLQKDNQMMVGYQMMEKIAKNHILITKQGFFSHDKIFFVIKPDSAFVRGLRMIFHSNCFYYVIIIGVLVFCISILVRTSNDSQEKQQILFWIERVSLSIYILEFLIGVFSYGLYFDNNSYLKQSKLNVLNLFICAFGICSEIVLIDPLYRRIIRRFMVLKIFMFFAQTSKEMFIILEAVSSIAKKFIRMYIVYIFILLIACVIPLKLLKDQFYSCSEYVPQFFLDQLPSNKQQCMLAGGDWIKQTQSFSNILSSMLLMYQIFTSQSWTYFIEKSNRNQPWDIYFVLMFFFYNVCLLNIFVGLIVQTYLQLKDKAFKLNLLRANQRAWILIKNCINELVPQPSVQQPSNDNFIGQLTFKIVTYQPYINIIDVMAYINAIIFMLKIYRSDAHYMLILNTLDVTFLVIFAIDTFLKIYSFRWSFFYLDNSKIQAAGLCFYVIYGILRISMKMPDQPYRILEFVSATFQLLRCKKLLFRFTWSKTLVNSVIEILPKCIHIGKLFFAVIFIYASIGMELFKYTKNSSKNDGYTTGFNYFWTGVLTLAKITSNESWFQQVTTFIRGPNPFDFCYDISNLAQAQEHRGMGCGSYVAFPFLISFHVISSLLAMNLLIATMTSAYDDNYEKQYNTVNIFQLQDCLQLWQKYDPKGSGVIPYKKFWRLSSQIAILFGISKKKLIKGKQKFLEQLDIEICQSTDPNETSVLCYKFHDVITKFSKIKLQVSIDRTDESSNNIDFDIDPLIQQEIDDYVTHVPESLYDKYRSYSNYTSGQMKYFFGLLRKMRAWRVAAKYKDSNTISKLSQIIKIAMQKRQKEQIVMNLILKNKKSLILHSGESIPVKSQEGFSSEEKMFKRQ